MDDLAAWSTDDFVHPLVGDVVGKVVGVSGTGSLNISWFDGVADGWYSPTELRTPDARSIARRIAWLEDKIIQPDVRELDLMRYVNEHACLEDVTRKLNLDDEVSAVYWATQPLSSLLPNGDKDG